MSLLLTLVQAPHPQPVRQMRLEDGELVIGRSADADWRIDDPDQYVSRAHCTVAGQAGAFTVTDTSRGGLFVDEGRAPLGPGRAMPLRNGMRLRLGDFVLRVDLRTAVAAEPQRRGPEVDNDAFFAVSLPEEPRRERPRDLPDPFERPGTSAPKDDSIPPGCAGPPEFDDPFTLDPASDRHRQRPAPGSFDWNAPAPEPRAPPPAAGGFDWGGPSLVENAAPQVPPTAARAPRQVGEAALIAAFLRGAGVDPADGPEGDPAARMEALGREYRMMAEGLMHLLRMRAKEKGNARIRPTLIASADVNPLKFMPTVEDALAVMVSRRAGGFVDAEAAIAGAVRDLAAHHVSTWRGTQAALARMIDRFDPAVLEKELDALGLLETLLAGGRRAKLWDLYGKRFREIARSAETRFLGEVGADFRDAYETEE